MVYNFGSAILRAKGDTKRPLYYLLAAGVINVILNLIFVIVFKLDAVSYTHLDVYKRQIYYHALDPNVNKDIRFFTRTLQTVSMNMN